MKKVSNSPKTYRAFPKKKKKKKKEKKKGSRIRMGEHHLRPS